MKNYNWKRTLIAAGLVGTLAVGVAAADAVRRNITAELRPDITVELNGSKQSLKDGNGNAVYPIIYNGSTYLPVRAVGQLAGMNVNWDSNTQTVELDDNGSSTGTATGNYIGKERAKEIALADAGLTYSNVTFFRVELEWDDGKPEYEVEFYSGNKEYDYEIDAVTGTIRSRDYDVENYTIPSTSTTDIGAEAAKSAALKHAGVSASNATFVQVERDWDDGRLVYEVEFYAGGKEYDYEIAAADGKVLSYDYDAEYYAPSTSTGASVTLEQAKSAALKHAGLSTATFVKAELDRDDGRQVYELEFRSGNVEYEYKVDASNGAILEAERDHD